MNRIIFAVMAALALVALAADDYQAGMDITTGASNVCVIARPKTNYSVRCTADAYVRTSPVNDGGIPATSKDVLVTAGKLYDIPTSSSDNAICALQSTASGSCYFYIFRSRVE